MTLFSLPALISTLPAPDRISDVYGLGEYDLLVAAPPGATESCLLLFVQLTLECETSSPEREYADAEPLPEQLTLAEVPATLAPVQSDSTVEAIIFFNVELCIKSSRER